MHGAPESRLRPVSLTAALRAAGPDCERRQERPGPAQQKIVKKHASQPECPQL